jgi:hypothetical protein
VDLLALEPVRALALALAFHRRSRMELLELLELGLLRRRQVSYHLQERRGNDCED